LNGFLLLLVAFEFRDEDAGLLDFSTLLVAAGLGYFIAAFVTPILDRKISEEPMVVTGLAIEAGAAFVAAQVFGLPAAATLAAAAGFAWGTAKFGFDGLLQATVPEEGRGRAFTNAETFFQVAWVVGALIPVVPVIPVEFGLTLAGLLALAIQVVYISAVLVPVVRQRRSEAAAAAAAAQERKGPKGNVLDLM
jgi:MFS family permease